MRTRHIPTGLVSLLAAAGLLAPAPAEAQDPDLRNIRPAVMLLVDTSGSMERMPGCVCSTPACNECEPACSATVGASESNRWATMLEALTGTFQDFTCAEEDRTGPAYVGMYDHQYVISHFRSSYTGQLSDGILDAYLGRVKFGLMTFDGIVSFTNTSPLVTESVFTARLGHNRTAFGDWSYGNPKSFTLQGCAEPFMMDAGGRNESATAGALVSIGDDRVDDSDIRNALIQSRLLGVRPFGATPIAPMLDDVEYYFTNHPDVSAPVSTTTGDPYFECRSRFVLLVTDGYPNADMREDPYNCDAPGASCPYDDAETIAARLCEYSSSGAACDGLVDGVFVVGFDIADAAVRTRLDDIAALGGTTQAYYADDRISLMDALAAVLDAAAPGTTSRTVPTFQMPSSGGSLGQHQFNTGFEVPTEDDEPWSGVLERHRFECDGTTPVERDVDSAQNDRFHEVLNARADARVLYTVIPSNASDVDSYLIGDVSSLPDLTGLPATPTVSGSGPGGAACTGTASTGVLGPSETGLTLQDLSSGTLTNAHLGVTTSTQRQDVLDWVYATSASTRADARLGDIYHSSPVVVGPPSLDLPDESYNEFRLLPNVSSRPNVLYVGTNDGILHAFVTEDTTIVGGAHDGDTFEAGEEIWGFVPPMLLPKLRAAMVSHQWMVDATPVVKDVFLERLPGTGADPDIYRTVLVVGLRGGGNGYFALDVTDPLDPKFLWQFTQPEMGHTYGLPGLGQVLMETDALQERAIAVLPGGYGDVEPAASCGGATTCTATGAGGAPTTTDVTSTRSEFLCWRTQGRHLYILDVATGQLITHIDDETFNSPLTGAVSFFSGEVGQVATRGYVTDHDGVIWRLDFTSTDPQDWSAAPFHDIFWDGTASDGQPGYAPPIVSTDVEGNVVILQATGDLDALETLENNRVVSLTEKLTFDTTGFATAVTPDLNWEIRLETGEQVTGPLELFESKVYFGTFTSTSDPINACEYGFSRLWGVHYRDADTATFDPVAGFDTDADGLDDATYLGPFDNQIVMGVAVTQRPSCFIGEVDTDFYTGTSHFRVTDGAPGAFELVAQVSGAGTTVGGGAVGEIRQTLPAPATITVASGWAGLVD